MFIEGIAAQCGFKNKSSLNFAFKADFGTTPVDWIKIEGLYSVKIRFLIIFFRQGKCQW